MSDWQKPRQSARQEIRSLEWIVKRVQKLSPAGRRWLMARLSAEECKNELPELHHMVVRRRAS